MKTSILIVDDDRAITDLIELYAKNEGFTIHKAYNGIEALEFMQRETIDVVILDIMMPTLDGLEVCRQIRKHHHTPILMLSAKVEDIDKITGLMTGADDYLEKPFNPLVLMARVKALLRRTRFYQQRPNENELIIRALHINKATHVAKADNKQLDLTPAEFNILYLLASNPNQVFSSEQIFERIWQEDGYGPSKTVMVHISNLRDKLEKATNGDQMIQTVWGVGYKIEN